MCECVVNFPAAATTIKVTTSIAKTTEWLHSCDSQHTFRRNKRIFTNINYHSHVHTSMFMCMYTKYFNSFNCECLSIQRQQT